MVIEIFKEIQLLFSEWNISWTLIGGLAVSAQAEPRFTRDIDILIAVQSDMEAESLAFRLGRKGWKIEAVIEQTYVKRLSTIRFTPNNSNGVVVDLLFASSGIEAEICNAAQPIEIVPNIILPVAQVGHLIALKLLSIEDLRPQDRIDLQYLFRTATDQDLTTTKEACLLITARGYNRDRNLTQLFWRYHDLFVI